MPRLYALQITLQLSAFGIASCHVLHNSPPPAWSDPRAQLGSSATPAVPVAILPAAESGSHVPTAPAPEPAVSQPEPSQPLIVGSERGVEAWRPDGTDKRLISAGPALQPRWLDRETLLVLHPLENTGELALERVSLHDGARKTIAKLPAFSCVEPGRKSGYPMELAVQSSFDFRVDLTKQLACVARMDRNYNMAGVRVSSRVDLRSHDSSSWLELIEASCATPKGLLAGDPPEESDCRYTADPEPEKNPRFAYEFDEHTLWEKTGEQRVAKLVLPDYYEERSSPSGRWSVLAGDEQEGDYMYRRVVLLDRNQGQIFPIPEQAGPMPQPLRAATGKSPQVSIPIQKASLITAETDVYWLAGDADSELLVLGSTIVIPGKRSFSIAGELAH